MSTQTKLQQSCLSKDEGYNDLGGTIRVCSPETTLARLKPYLKDLGITRVANITGLDCLNIPVAVSVRPNSKHLAVSQGKGLTWELAAVSAIMESIEGYHAENPAAPNMRGTYETLCLNHPVIDPETFPSGFFEIPDLKQYPMDWIKAEDMLTGQEVFIPHVLISLDSTQLHPEYAFFMVSSNGLAAGNHIDEAVCHGLYEIIERDALYQWGSQNDNLNQIQLETIDSPVIQDVLERFFAAKQRVKLWDITSKIGVPTYHCVIYDTHALRQLGMHRGTGTHLSKDIAVLRALTEAAQSRVTVISGSRDDVFLDHYQQMIETPEEAQFRGHKDYRTCLQPEFSASFKGNRDHLVKQLADQGFSSIFCVNHTKPEFDIPVAHIIVPGLQFNGMRI